MDVTDETGNDLEDDVVIQVLRLIGGGVLPLIVVLRADYADHGLVEHAQIEVLQGLLAHRLQVWYVHTDTQSKNVRVFEGK